MRRLSLGGFAQIATFGAGLLPIAFRQPDVLVFLLSVTAPVVISLQVLLQGATVRVPLAPTLNVARALVVRVEATLVCASAALAVGAWATTTLAPASEYSRFLSASAVLLFGQGSYLLMVALLTRLLRVGAAMAGRFVYGLCLVIGTFVALSLEASEWVYPVLAGGAYLMGAASMIAMVAASGVNSEPEEATSGPVTVVRSAPRLVASQTLSAVSAQASALALPGLGPAASGWAMAVRLSSGMQTIGGHVLAVEYDARAARAMRAAGNEVAQVMRRAQFGGGMLVLVYGLALTGSLLWVGTGTFDGWLAFGAVVYLPSLVFFSPLDRLASIVIDSGTRLVLEALRALLSLLVLIFLGGTVAVAVLGLVSIVFVVTYVAILGAAAKRNAWLRTLNERIAGWLHWSAD